MSTILVLAREVPYPPNAGDRLVTFGFVKALSERGHDVHVLARSRDDGPVDGLGRYCTSVTRVPQSTDPLPTTVRKTMRYALGRSHVMAMFDSEQYRNATADRIRAVAPDVVLAQHPYMGQMFLDSRVEAAVEATGARQVTNAHVVEYAAHERHRSHAESLATQLELAAEAPRLREAELAVYDQSDRTLVLSDRDRRELADKVSGPVRTQRVIVDTDRYDPATPAEAVDGRLLFFGSYDWFPNEDAITYFSDDVFPAIRREYPDAELVVAGRGAPPSVEELGERQGVRFLGEVDDLGSLVRTASAVVAPVRVGGGVRIKVLESMAWQAPVVTTPSGFEGVEATPGEDLVVAGGASAFADATVDLLQNPERRGKIARSARATVAERYSTEAVAEELERNLGIDTGSPDQSPEVTRMH